MKKITFLLSIFCLTYTIATAQVQTYDLDATFGNEGIVETNIDFAPTDVKLINGYYYFISDNRKFYPFPTNTSSETSGRLVKVDYSGNFDTSFGNNGIVSFSINENIKHTVSGFKYINGYFYIYGSTNQGYGDTQTYNQELYITKIDEEGNFDTEFGINGIATFNFNNNESLQDLTIDENGRLFCMGTVNRKITYFKVMPNGTLDTTFGTNGLKNFLLNNSSFGYRIKQYNGNYLLIGTDTYSNYPNSNTELILLLVDVNGNLISSFGNNGYKAFTINPGMSSGILWLDLVDDKLYAVFSSAYAEIPQLSTKSLFKYDILNDQTEFIKGLGYNYHTGKMYNNKIYLTGFENCMGGQTFCESDFMIQRRHLYGDLDGSFASYEGEYNYNFEDSENSITYDRSSTFEIDENGKILIAGYTHSKFSMIRIQEGALNTDTFSLTNNSKVYPNPFSDYLVIDNIKETPTNIEVTDISGRVICKPLYTKEGESIRLDLSSITQKGIYIVKSSYEDKTVFNKIIKE